MNMFTSDYRRIPFQPLLFQHVDLTVRVRLLIKFTVHTASNENRNQYEGNLSKFYLNPTLNHNCDSTDQKTRVLPKSKLKLRLCY